MSEKFSIIAKQLSFHYKGESSKFNPVLNDISFTLERGKTLALIGRNGTGKTTLLKILAQILKPVTGTAEIYGYVAALIDIDGFFDKDLTGRENVKHYLKINGWKLKEIETILEVIKELSGLESYFDNTFKTYSKGMQSRLILSTAFQLKAQLFLIDEVFFAGDAGFIEQIKGFKNELSRKGVSFIIATHNTEEVKQFADKCIWLHESKIKLIGNSDVVLKEYHKTIVQEISLSKGKIYSNENGITNSNNCENEFLRVIKIEQLNKENFTYSNGFCLIIEYEQFNTTFDILPGLKILDYNKRILCVSSAFNSINNENQSLKKIRIVEFQFPSETLVKGHYFIEVIFSKISHPELPHLEEVLKFPDLIPLIIHPDKSIVFGEDDPILLINLKAEWKYKNN